MPFQTRAARSLLALALIASLVAAGAPAAALGRQPLAAGVDRTPASAPQPSPDARDAGHSAPGPSRGRRARHRRPGPHRPTRGVGPRRLGHASHTGCPRAQAEVDLEGRAGGGRRRRRLEPIELPGSQPRLDPRARDQSVGVVLLVLVDGLPGRPRLSMGLCRLEQRLPVRPCPQRVPAAPRRVRPRPPVEGHEGHLRRRQRPGHDVRRRVVEGHHAGQGRLRLRGPVAPEPDAPDLRRRAGASTASSSGCSRSGRAAQLARPPPAAQTTRRPSTERAITRRWIWLVPSPISVSFASRMKRSTG